MSKAATSYKSEQDLELAVDASALELAVKVLERRLDGHRGWLFRQAMHWLKDALSELQA